MVLIYNCTPTPQNLLVNGTANGVVIASGGNYTYTGSTKGLSLGSSDGTSATNTADDNMGPKICFPSLPDDISSGTHCPCIVPTPTPLPTASASITNCTVDDCYVLYQSNGTWVQTNGPSGTLLGSGTADTFSIPASNGIVALGDSNNNPITPSYPYTNAPSSLFFSTTTANTTGCPVQPNPTPTPSSVNDTTLWIVLGSVGGFVVLVMILWFLFR